MVTKNTFGSFLNQDTKGARKALPSAFFKFKKAKFSPAKKLSDIEIDKKDKDYKIGKNPYSEVK